MPRKIDLRKRLLKRLSELGFASPIDALKATLIFKIDETVCLSSISGITLFTSPEGYDTLTFFTNIRETLAHGYFRGVEFDFETNTWRLIDEDDTATPVQVEFI